MTRLHSTALPVLAIVFASLGANTVPSNAPMEAVGEGNDAILGTQAVALRDGVEPAPAYLLGLDWSNYRTWDRDMNGNRVDDLIEAAAVLGISALPSLPDGFLPFEARESSAGLVLDAWIAYDTGVAPADVDALAQLGITALKPDAFRPGLWALGITPVQAISIAALPGVEMVELEQRFRALNSVSRGATQVEDSTSYADGVWDDLGYDGSGVGVAVLDTGVDDNHQSLKGHFLAGADTVSTCGTLGVEANPDDDNHVGVALIGVGPLTYHGTHVSGSILGQGAGTPAAPGLNAGMAPGATLYDVKVLTSPGLSCTGSVATGLAWVYNFNTGSTLWKSLMGVPASASIQIVSMSLGGACSNGSDSLSATVDVLTGTGVLSVIAVGNDGLTNCISSPAAALTAVSVGAYDSAFTVSRSNDVHASFSNCGPSIASPTAAQLDQRKPDVTAPGVNVLSAWGDATPNGIPDGFLYHGLSGTSMATPIVAGIAALMLEADPTLSPADVKDVLRDTATQPSAYGSMGYLDTTYTTYHSCWGWGQVNAYNAVNSL